jgi:hypothetical protein
MSISTSAWRCHAKPGALGGKKCGHLNLAGEAIRSQHGPCCASCGCTQIAGSDRYKREFGCKGQLWFVDYQARETPFEKFAPVRITVVASGHDDAYQQARYELGERLELGFPISAEPVMPP